MDVYIPFFPKNDSFAPSLLARPGYVAYRLAGGRHVELGCIRKFDCTHIFDITGALACHLMSGLHDALAEDLFVQPGFIWMFLLCSGASPWITNEENLNEPRRLSSLSEP